MGGTTPAYESGAWNSISRVLFKQLELLPIGVGQTNRFCDDYYNPAETSGFRLVVRSGDLYYGGLCGLSVVYGSYGVGDAYADFGSSLFEVTEEWSVDGEYVEV